MASKWRDLAEASWLDCGRNGVITGERVFVEITKEELSGGADSATPPKIGDAWSVAYPLCVLTSARLQQYMGSQNACYVCRYTSDEYCAGVTGQPVPRDRYTAGGEMYALSKTLTANWTTAPTDQINQASQMIIPNGQFETYLVNDVKVDAYQIVTDWIGGVSKTKPMWMCVSAEVMELYGLKGAQLVTDTPALYYRVKFIFAYRKDGASLGWNALYRENVIPPAWQLTDAPTYAEVDDFASVVPI